MDLCVDKSMWDQYPTSSGCSADEMDLCIDIPPTASCEADDEMDLCPPPTTYTATSVPVTTAIVTTTAAVTTTIPLCSRDEMDLCTDDAGSGTDNENGVSVQ